MDTATETISCLSKTFTSEEERREYFRAELREKLPDLKKIEGFPIGEDEDILALSDPPYYTACPNPWLNDFIADWENEKESIKNRKKDFHVVEPYASDVSEGKNNPIYTAHTYHTKVPHPAIMRYILHYTQPGDIVLDAFGGTGMTGVAAQICERPDNETRMKIEIEWRQMFNTEPNWGLRKAICGDLSPYASLISYNYNSPVEIEVFETETQILLDNVTKDCTWLYETRHSDGGIGIINYIVWSDVFVCKSCNNEIVYWEAALDVTKKEVLDNFHCKNCNTINSKKSDKAWVTTFDSALKKTVRIAKSVPVLKVYTYKGKRYEAIPEEFDFLLIKKINESNLPYWVPSYELPYGYNTEQPKNSHGITNIHLFYTKRNLIALSILNEKILSSKLPNKLRFILTAIINRSTQMNRIHVNNYFFGGGGWNAGYLKGTLYVPSIPIETSILEQISDKINSLKKAVINLKKQYSNVQYVGSATGLPLKENSVDYIFTDPPFGANIMYSELNFLPEGWLKVISNNKKEAIENKAQNKTLLQYQELMAQCFKEYYRLLKPDKWMTVEFSNTNASVWNGIQTAIQKAGFIIGNVAALDKKQGSFKAVTTPTAVKQDLVISCYKPSLNFQKSFNSAEIEHSVWNFVREHLSHLPIHIRKGNKTTAVVERSPKILYDRLISFYLMRGLPIPVDAIDFQAGLKQRYMEKDGMFFTNEQSAEYDVFKQKFADSEQLVLAFNLIYNESDAINWLKHKLNERSIKRQDLYTEFVQATVGLRKNDVLPDLDILLNENFIQESDGKWRTPDLNEAKDRETLRSRTLLKEFAKYVEESNKPKAKKIKEVRVEALRAGFKQCWEKKDFVTIVSLADKIPQNILLEDEQLLMYYDIAKDRI
jgi:DNA modification methylase